MDGLELKEWDAAQAVHEVIGVVPVHPIGGEQFHFGQTVQRPPPKRWVAADGFGFVQPYRRFRQGVVEGIRDRADVGHQSGQSEGFRIEVYWDSASLW